MEGLRCALIRGGTPSAAGISAQHRRPMYVDTWDSTQLVSASG